MIFLIIIGFLFVMWLVKGFISLDFSLEGRDIRILIVMGIAIYIYYRLLLLYGY